MDLAQFDQLGLSLRDAYRQHNFNEQDFPFLAAEQLKGLDFDFQWHPETLADFLFNTNVAQDPDREFSNLPLIVYRCPEFYIQILVWTSGTTAIHEHSFSGAFKVLLGSSIHSTYNFVPERQISSKLATGTITQLKTEYLGPGGIRTINPGRDGLVHSLFHLQNPSATLVIRTPGAPAFLPQMTLLPPHFAISEGETDDDTLVKMVAKLLHTAKDIDQQDFVQIYCDEVPKLDFPRLLAVLLGTYGTMPSLDIADRFYQQVAKHHGHELMEKLADSVQEARKVDNLRAARRGTSDENMRFFLALLMNVRHREGIIGALEERYPDDDPVQKCAAFMTQLCQQKQDTGRIFARMSAMAGIKEYLLGSKLATHVPPSLSSEEMSAYFIELIGEPQQSIQNIALVADRRSQLLNAIPELAPLF